MAQALYDPISDIQTEWDTTGVDHYTEIDEGTTPVLSDYVETKADYDLDEWGFPTPSESGINFIKAYVYAETGGNATCVIRLRQGGVKRADYAIPVGQGQQWFSCQWDNPFGDLSELTISAQRIKSGGGGPTYSTVYTAYLEVDYSAGPPSYYHGLKVQGEGELALCDAGSHPLRIRKGGTTYGIELVDTGDPNASRVRIKIPAGIKAIRRYT